MNTTPPTKCRHCGRDIEYHPAPHTYNWRHTARQQLWCPSGRSMAEPHPDH